MHEWFERVYAGTFTPAAPIVMTLHVPGRDSGFAEYHATHPGALLRQGMHFVAISEYQRRQYADVVPVAGTVPHGIDVAGYAFGAEPEAGGYLFSIGRMTRVKGHDTAVAVAKRCGAKLILAGCVQNKSEDRAFFSTLKDAFDLVADVGEDPVRGDYFERVMKPILSSDKQVIYIGELDTEAKKHWFRHARATLFPIRWGEPFGMVLIESMAAGTPIVAFRRGAVPEIVRDGETGFVVDSVESMVEAVGRLDRIDRRECRRHVTEHFSLQRMAEGYEGIYERVRAAHRRSSLPPTTVRRAPALAMKPRHQPAATG
jgi:glycosyltransferase involved in cell wall biosynthesis